MNGSYRQSAAFLGYVTDKYDKELVRKLNALLRRESTVMTIWFTIGFRPAESRHRRQAPYPRRARKFVLASVWLASASVGGQRPIQAQAINR